MIAARFDSTTPGERPGSSIDATHDFDGDGFVDFLVGAPKFRSTIGFEVGRAVVFSGLLFRQPNFDPVLCASSHGANPQPPTNHSDPSPNYHFGSAVRACTDLNGDGVGEILVGAPDCFTPGLLMGWNFCGLVELCSGASGQLLTTISGASASGADCTGSITFDVNARIQGGLDPTLVVGAEMFCQCWSRDPASPSQTSLSNALRFAVNP